MKVLHCDRAVHVAANNIFLLLYLDVTGLFSCRMNVACGVCFSQVYITNQKSIFTEWDSIDAAC